MNNIRNIIGFITKFSWGHAKAGTFKVTSKHTQEHTGYTHVPALALNAIK
jgi:hypothetical protein